MVFFSPIYTGTPPSATAVAEVSPGLSFRLGSKRALSAFRDSQAAAQSLVRTWKFTAENWVSSGQRLEHCGRFKWFQEAQSGSVTPEGHGTLHRQGKRHGVVSLPSAQKSSRLACIQQGAKPSVYVPMKTELLWKHAGVHMASEHNRDNTCVR